MPHWLLCFMLILLNSSYTISMNFCTEFTTIKAGDSCWQVANSVGIEVESLKKMNPGVDCDSLWVGQKLCTAQSITKKSCTKTVKVGAGDNCYKIWTDNGLSEQEFIGMNVNLNCNPLSVGQIVCVSWDLKYSTSKFETATREAVTTTEITPTTANSTTDDENHLPLPLVENEPECFEYSTVQNGDTCYSIAQEFHLNLSEVRKQYDCDHLKTGDTFCVSINFTCQHRYLIRNGDSCHSIGKVFKLDPLELKAMNEDLNCDDLKIGRRICVWSAQERKLRNMRCNQTKVVERASYCSDISHQFSITIDEFQFLNPNISCERPIRQSSIICISGESSIKNCSSIQLVPTDPHLTCSNLATRHSMSVPLLIKFNPTLKCGKLNQTNQICTGTGSFNHSNCTDFIRIAPEFDTCQKIQNETGLTLEQIKTLNPFINCDRILSWNSLVCTSNLGMDTRTAQQIVVTSLKTVIPELSVRFRHFLKNPTESNSFVLNQLLLSSIQKPEVNAKMKELYEQDSEFRKILNSQLPLPRQEYCEQVLKSTTTQAIKSCFCQKEELLIYCQALAVEWFQENERKLARRHEIQRAKRSVGCQFITPTSGSSFVDYITTSKEQCWGGECSIPVGAFEANLDAKLCFPNVELVEHAKKFKVCFNQRNDCETANADDAGALKLIAKRSVDLSLKLCAIGSNVMEKLKAIGAGICFDIVSVSYYGLVGKLNIGSALNLALVKLSGGATIKVHDMVFPNICKDVDVECEDYCKWRDWENGRAYGNIEARLFSLLGWDGVKIFEETFNEPDKLGCKVGEKAAVILRNDRTCENELDRNVWRCCWSRDTGKCTFELMEQERGFSFVPNWIGNTVFTCEFVDKDIENIDTDKIGFDVYGAKSSNHGKRNFYYVAKNDGMYFGTEKYKEDKLVMSWKNPCQELVEIKGGQREPSGKSPVPAASCGKRIVGYYTGWGEREITENQLRKLTHVIFAFVAMKSDGSLEFDSVSEDDTGPGAGAKAKRRFLEMESKARSVNAGVHILFAVGGWDNSQYFAPVAADPVKRANFIDHVATFLETYEIDGVDLDWEYPDEKGADKNNHVTLLRELRQKLDAMARLNNRKSKYLITMATAAGEWNLRDGYDLTELLNYADFLNVMTYDYYGAWASKWGAYTGPPSPLYYGNLKGFSGKLNADFTMKLYSCKTRKPNMLNMGVPFYGRFWRNVEDPIGGGDGMWRSTQKVNGKFEGGFVGWRNLEKQGWNKEAATWHEKTRTPYIFNSGARMFLGFENERSLQEKMSYATSNNLGGIMIWALDLDDDAETLLELVSSTNLCSGGISNEYICNPLDEVRWWTPENSDEFVQGQCGKSAKLINGFYPVCDPDDPGFSCCGAEGYCGNDEEYCECETCVNYRKNPMDVLKEPIKPSREVQWYVMSDEDGKRGRCGKNAPLLNGKEAICNPDDDSKHCCSNGGYCGTGTQFCECDECVDYRKQI